MEQVPIIAQCELLQIRKLLCDLRFSRHTEKRSGGGAADIEAGQGERRLSWHERRQPGW